MTDLGTPLHFKAVTYQLQFGHTLDKVNHPIAGRIWVGPIVVKILMVVYIW